MTSKKTPFETVIEDAIQDFGRYIKENPPLNGRCVYEDALSDGMGNKVFYSGGALQDLASRHGVCVGAFQNTPLQSDVSEAIMNDIAECVYERVSEAIHDFICYNVTTGWYNPVNYERHFYFKTASEVLSDTISTAISKSIRTFFEGIK